MLSPEMLNRYDRQLRFGPIGPAGQRRLAAGRVAVVGVGGLGSWLSELLVRAGVGMLRLIDDDRVELVNIHRQGLYTPADARDRLPKVQAAAGRLRELNEQAQLDTRRQRLSADNVAELCGDVDVIADGSDNFATRFIINDYAVKARRPWVMAGVVGAEGQVMPVSPGASACLRCVLPSPPPQCADPTCTAAGVIGPAVAAVAAVAACWVLRVLVDPQGAAAEARLSKLDLWGGQSRQIDVSRPAADCPCCVRGQYDYLDA